MYHFKINMVTIYPDDMFNIMVQIESGKCIFLKKISSAINYQYHIEKIMIIHSQIIDTVDSLLSNFHKRRI